VVKDIFLCYLKYYHLARARATAADAYCYHVALKYERAPHALRSMALDADHGDYVSRCKTAYEDVAKKIGTRSKRFERASLEAYLLSPFIGKRPKLVRVSQARQPTAVDAESSSAASPMDLDPHPELLAGTEPQQASDMVVEPDIELAAEPEPQGCLAAQRLKLKSR